MNMTVGELRAMIDGLGDDVVVRMANQPNYPMEHEVSHLKLVSPKAAEIEQVHGDITGGELNEEELVEANKLLTELQAVPEILYVVEGSWVGYSTRDHWDH